MNHVKSYLRPPWPLPLVGLYLSLLLVDTECCTSLTLSSSGDALIAQPFSFGKYVLNLTMTKDNAHNIYKKVNDHAHDHYLFRMAKLNVWAIGPTVGVNYFYLVHVDGSILCPENLNNNDPWFYLGSEKTWRTNDNSIDLTCNF